MKLRLPGLREKKTFRLFIGDAGDEPPAAGTPEDAWFGSLRAALSAADRLDDRWKSLAWVIEYQDQPSFGGIPVVRDIVHMRYGVRVDDATSGSSGD
jgi:hypothetical protein